jgi:hypothetical protein
MIEGDAAEPIAEGGDLRLEHGSAEQKPVREHDRLPFSAGIREVDMRTVQISVRHPDSPDHARGT